MITQAQNYIILEDICKMPKVKLKINFQMDMTMCPYVKYAKILKVEKLTSIFCESDFTTYGNLSGIVFERTQTLGTGGNLCDFKFSRIEK